MATIQCKDCGLDTFPGYGSHHCVVEKDDGTHITMWKVWNDTAKFWEVKSKRDSGPKPNDKSDEFSYFDIAKSEWVTLRFGPKGGPNGSYLAASCEIPPKVEHKTPLVYTPVRPWEGVDRNRFPATWQILVYQYFQYDWWKGKYLKDEDYRDRILRGVYVKEEKTNYYSQRYDYGQYD